MINGAVNEFIQDKKLWFRHLHKQHGDEIKAEAIEKGQEFLPNTAMAVGKDVIPIEGDIEEEALMKELKEKSLALQQKFDEEAEQRGSESTESEDEDDEEKWDAETILSTYTNTDNHPSVIKYVPRVKTN
jgi:hypothetical protein